MGQQHPHIFCSISYSISDACPLFLFDILAKLRLPRLNVFHTCFICMCIYIIYRRRRLVEFYLFEFVVETSRSYITFLSMAKRAERSYWDSPAILYRYVRSEPDKDQEMVYHNATNTSISLNFIFVVKNNLFHNCKIIDRWVERQGDKY